MTKLNIMPLLATFLVFVNCGSKSTQKEDSQSIAVDSIGHVVEDTLLIPESE